MRIRLLSISQKSPSWIKTGYEEYAKRLQSSCQLELIEIPGEKRAPNAPIATLMQREGMRMLERMKPHHYSIALDEKGKSFTSLQFSQQIARLQEMGQPIDFLIGGADGLAPQCAAKANAMWSLSKLTFPHLLVRLILVEQLYRAFSILKKHPYHRA